LILECNWSSKSNVSRSCLILNIALSVPFGDTKANFIP
jgi:hypothetical protein